jgi:glycerophosphoryl diester phosphodiesterase
MRFGLLVLAMVACTGTKDTGTPDTGDTDTGVDDTGDTGEVPTETTPWDHVDRAIATTPAGHQTAVACHNCYVEGTDSSDSLTGTLAAIHAAQGLGADLIELDVKAQAGVWHLEHEDIGYDTGALLSEVLADSALLAGDQLLFIEFKETEPDPTEAAALLDLVVDAGYGVEGRPVIFRAFIDEREPILDYLRTAAETSHPDVLPHLRFHVLFQVFSAFDVTGFQDLVDDAVAAGRDGVELHVGTPGLPGVLTYARALDLTTAAWTFSETNGTRVCSGMRDLIDIAITESPLDECRAAIGADNSMAQLDVWDEEAGGDLDGVSLEAVTGAPWGTVLSYTGSESTDLGTHDASGFLLSAMLQLGDLDLAVDATMPIVGNDVARLFLRGTDAGTELVLAAKVGGTEAEAVAASSRLNTSGGTFVLGYLEDGALRLTVNQTGTGVVDAEGLTGSLDTSAAPWTLGADPAGTAHFVGKVQFVSIQEI